MPCVYKSHIEFQQNYSDKWLVGADSVRNSSIRDHTCSDQHIHAMSIYCTMADGSSISGKPTNKFTAQSKRLDLRSHC